MTVLSRVDLLVLLADTPAELHADLAALLGFGITTSTSTTITLPVSGANYDDEPEILPVISKQPEYKHRIWYIQQYQSRYVQQQQTKEKKTRTRKRTQQPNQAELFSNAQKQVLWDRCLNQQQKSKQPDIPAVIHQLAQAKPIKKLPCLKRETNNHETILFLDRSEHLTPIWEDQLTLAKSLQKLLGTENCQVLLMSQGISGSIQKQWSNDDNWSFDQLPEAARLVFISDLGFYSTQADNLLAWQQSLQQLKDAGHYICVINPRCQPENRFSFQQISLDNKVSQFSKLQSAIVACLQPVLARIRQLREQVAEGCLEDELMLWNHVHRMPETGGLVWRLAPEYLYTWATADHLSDYQQQRLYDLHARWRASMHIETEGIEQWIEEVLDPEHKKANASLLDHALDQYEHQVDKHSSAYRWLFSQLALINMFETCNPKEDKWQRVYQLKQQVQIQNKLAFTQGLRKDNKEKAVNISQVGAGLHCHTIEKSTLKLISEQALIIDLKVDQQLVNGAKLTTSSARLRTLQADIHLQSMTQPDWSERYWQDNRGIYATHADNALFFLQAASAEYPQAQWLCQHNPWTWASDVGIDGYGLWADLQVQDATYRLRWIKAGQFMMGSPESEKERREDETLHQVTLSQGYWLGETSCTQVFWQAVMGENPSYNTTHALFPVENISWEDCQNFISRLRQLHPDFLAELPTEAQWEYACRAGSKTAYWWGEELDKRYANNGSQTELEAQYPTNAYGLKSMSGNVDEWCTDWLGDYVTSPVQDPTGSLTGQLRVLRGGSWYSSGRFLRSAKRLASGPDDRSRDIGFRLAGGNDPQASEQPFSAHRGPWSGQAMGTRGLREDE